MATNEGSLIDRASVHCTNRWFHPNVTAKEAKELLLNQGRDGSFLVRRSRKSLDDYTICIRKGNHVQHFKIHNNGDCYSLGNGQDFATLHHLVSFYTVEGNPLCQSDGNTVEIRQPLYSGDTKLDDQPWFHGHITASDADELLKTRGGDGDFLVRERQNTVDGYVLCVKNAGSTLQILVTYQAGKYFIQVPNVKNIFLDIDQLIEFYRSSPIELSSGAKLILKSPVTRKSTDEKDKNSEEHPSPTKKDPPITFSVSENLAMLEQEFELLNKEVSTQPTLAGQQPECLAKNRYKNILPFDKNRVVLRDVDKTCVGSDYINASSIMLDESSFIATQGALADTLSDFWQMIWQENVDLIIMVSNVVESGRYKCHCYWPENSSEDMLLPVYKAFFNVHFEHADQFEGYVVRKFSVVREDIIDTERENGFTRSQPRTVYQYHFTAWMDKSVPSVTDHVIDFVLHVHSVHEELQRTSPIVVHCSAGVGRTGTFMAIYVTLQMLIKLGHAQFINIPDIVRKLRTQRIGLVQTSSQYIFVYRVWKDLVTDSSYEYLFQKNKHSLKRRHVRLAYENVTF